MVKSSKNANNHQTVGWREWLTLPSLGIPAIKAKIDTGARTSAIHAFQLVTYSENAREYVRFRVHPLQRNSTLELECVAPIIDKRIVRDSGGHAEERYVIETDLEVVGQSIPIEITLTSREDMLFKMLLGRTAIVASAMLVDPSRSFVLGRGLGNVYKTNPDSGEIS